MLRFFLKNLDFIIKNGIIELLGGENMLINFKFSNFRSFKNETEFSMLASRQTSMNDILIRKNNLRILPCTVVYGANASGKTNLIMAILFMRELVIRGSIKDNLHGRPVISNLELLPFFQNGEKKPIKLEMDFIIEDMYFRYGIEILCGCLQKKGRKIEKEYLKVALKNNGSSLANVFTRTDKVVIEASKELQTFLDASSSDLTKIQNLINKNLDQEELFLTSGFKNTVSKNISEKITDFFIKKLIVLEDFLSVDLKQFIKIPKNIKNKKGVFLTNRIIDKAIVKTDFGPHKIGFVLEEDTDEKDVVQLEMYSLYGKNLIPASLMESRGTIKLIEILPILGKVFEKGGVCIIDELDSSMHSEIIKGIISAFNNPDINKKGGQLIFTSHNPIYLDNQLLRRDQITFIERSETDYSSCLYNLSDVGSKNIRNDENYLINYFKGKYARLPYINFEEVFNGDEDTDEKR